MADLSVRQATQDDFDDVMEVAEDLPGVDYLWCRYHYFLADPYAQCYVGTINSDVVAFCSAFLIDDRQTYIIRAARIKAGVRGQGVYGKMLEHIRQEFKNIPRITRDVIMLNTNNFSRMKGRLLQTYKHILSRVFNMLEITCNDRLGKKVRVKCNPEDTIGDLKKLIAAQTGTQHSKIVLKKWYNVFKDNISLADYEIHDGMNLELYYS